MPEPWAALQDLLEDGCTRGVYTAAVALVGLKGDLRWQGAAGVLSRDPQAPAAGLDTLFDLASLTKPLATALALMILVDRGRLQLTTPLGEILPSGWLPPDKQPLTLASLLTHRAGLPAWQPFYQELLAAPPPERPTLLERLAAITPLLHSPDTVTLYSDLGFMLLKAVVETVSGLALDRFCAEKIYRPLGLNYLGFNPRQQPGGGGLSFAAT
ncbi:MAG TPA: serine hydrolase domain-containing protein, partial [Desulfobaccales bacterium]|nr:serine hydrolase domain-containing protein [Desulfobaccales bacterium]